MAVATSRALALPDLRDARSAAGRGTARVCDAALAACVLGLGAWTLAYHACLLLRLGSGWALAGLATAVVPCLVLAARSDPARDLPTAPEPGAAGGTGGALAGVAGVAALGAAGALAFADWPWPAKWALWLAAAAAAALASVRAPLMRRGGVGSGTAAALSWAAGLAALSLFLVRADADDAYYLRQATWIAEHGRFPVGDTLHSHDALPAVFSPPIPSYEALVGTVAAAAGAEAPAVAYLVVAPVASALSVLAVWRLLRTWEVRLAGPALTVALVFLLTAVEPRGGDADLAHAAGNFFVARAWQGKVILAAVLVPLLLALLHEHAAHPRPRGLVLLAAAGAAGVGLSTTAAFLVPVVALACLAPLAARAPWRAVAALAATCAYPAAGMAAALLADARQPARWKPHEVAPEVLVLPALGAGLLAFLAVAAALAAPLLLTSRWSRRGMAAVALLVALLFAPGLPELIYAQTGLGRPLWRLMWAMPIAALLGVVATQPLAWHPVRVVRALPALGVCGVLILAGTPVWDGHRTRLADRPAWKRSPAQLAVAREIAARAAPGAVVLAPARLSQTLLLVDGRLTTVAPRYFYTSALPRSAQAHVEDRLLLWAFANHGLRPDVRAGRVVPALRRAGVDVACVRATRAPSRRLLAAAGFGLLLERGGVWCGAQDPSVTSPVSPGSSASSARVAPEPVNPPGVPGSIRTASEPPGAVTTRSAWPSSSVSSSVSAAPNRFPGAREPGMPGVPWE
jgi:hypothetical protein